MAPLTPPTRGFVADIRAARQSVPRNTKQRHIVAAVALLLSSVLLLQLVPDRRDNEASQAVTSQPAVISNEYIWRVYELNQTARTDNSTGTMFTFRTEDLPYDFRSIQFGDFRADAGHTGKYYGGCGILVNASGTNATIALRESSGSLISTVPYNGQDLIVFSGERISVSYPSASTRYYGTDRMIQDWRNGTWSPNDGIVVEHPGNVTLSGSEFCLMVFEPDGDIEIPEFQGFPFVIACILAVLVIFRRRRLADGRIVS